MSAGSHQYFRKPPDLDRELDYLIQFVLKETASSSTQSSGHHQPAVHVVTHVNRGVSPVIQNGPMCGLVALTMASTMLGGFPKGEDEAHPETLFQLARQHGTSKNGEIFAVEFLRDIAEDQLHCQAGVVELASLDILDTVLLGKGLLVPYDADKDHTPCLERGHKAHWCLVVGIAVVLSDVERTNYSDILDCCKPNLSLPGHFVIREDRRTSFLVHKQLLGSLAHYYVFARHGKSSHLGLWKFSDLLESNKNLVEIDPKRTRPGEYIIPEGGIKEGLCGKALLISKHQ